MRIKAIIFSLFTTNALMGIPTSLQVYELIKNEIPKDYVLSSERENLTDYGIEIDLTFRVSFELKVDIARKSALELQQRLIKKINDQKELAHLFNEATKKNVSVGLLRPLRLVNIPWIIGAVSTFSKGLLFSATAKIEDSECGFKYGQETYKEAERIIQSQPPYEKTVTFTQWGHFSIPLELHGSWGFFIERAVAEQIRSGNYIYYAEVDGKKHKLAAKEHQVIVEATGQPIVELWTPLKQKYT